MSLTEPILNGDSVEVVRIFIFQNFRDPDVCDLKANIPGQVATWDSDLQRSFPGQGPYSPRWQYSKRFRETLSEWVDLSSYILLGLIAERFRIWHIARYTTGNCDGGSSWKLIFRLSVTSMMAIVNDSIT
jgi:hypothetical protein